MSIDLDDVEVNPLVYHEDDILQRLTNHVCPDEDASCGHNHCFFIRLAVRRIRNLLVEVEVLQTRLATAGYPDAAPAREFHPAGPCSGGPIVGRP